MSDRPVIEFTPVKKAKPVRPVVELEASPDASDEARFARFASSRAGWKTITGSEE